MNLYQTLKIPKRKAMSLDEKIKHIQTFLRKLKKAHLIHYKKYKDPYYRGSVNALDYAIIICEAFSKGNKL